MTGEDIKKKSVWARDWLIKLIPLMLGIIGFFIMKGYEIDKNVYILQERQNDVTKDIQDLQDEVLYFMKEQKKHNREQEKAFIKFSSNVNSELSEIKNKQTQILYITNRRKDA